MKTLIKNVRIITPNEVLDNFGIVIEEGKIEDIVCEDDIDIYNIKNIIDGDGQYLAPGFVDIHNHGNSGFDIMDSTEEALDEMGRYHISKGITSYLGTIITSSYEDMEKAAENIVKYKNKEDIAEIIGIHLEGPFFNTNKKGAQPDKYIKLPDKEYIKRLLKLTSNNLKMVSLAPELEGAIDIIRLLKDNNIVVSIAHSDANYNEAKKGIENGITVATHLYNGMKGFSHREPGAVGAALTDDRVYCEIIYDRFHLHDIAVKIALDMKGYDKIVLISDAMMAAGLEEGEYLLGGQKVFVKDGKPRLETGGIAGSTLNLQKAVYNMVNYLQVPIHEAVKMASLNPSRSINMDKDIGSIERGKKADLILFDEEINIKDVYLGGKLVWKEN
ncbi:MAG TPA: N-acetylglucosamine-6-phosphate deacetylase [Tissierellaceae bacterium]|nr:N-acetylglucosamine-6-phosphate deacetylase [Tissierellaceae bacterium]